MKYVPEYIPIRCSECGSRERFPREGADPDDEAAWYRCPECEDYQVTLVL